MRRIAAAWWPMSVLAVASTLIFANSGAQGGLTGSVRNTGSKAQSGSLITSATVGAVNECDLSSAAYTPIATTNTAACTGTLLPSGTVPAAGTAAVSTVVANKGSVTPSAASLTKGICGAVSLANSVVTTNPMLVRGTTLSYAQTGPLTGGTGLGLSGTSGYAAEAVTVTAPTTSTQVIWFKATVAGTLMGFTSTPSTVTPTSYDRILWVDSTGHVVFGVNSASKTEITSPAATYLDGAWHFVAGTVGASGMVLSIDGTTVATNASVTSTPAYAGFWHVGWDNQNTGWTNPPTNPYFTGTLANAAVFPALTTTQVSNLGNAGTQTAWATLLTSSGATRAWTLGDNGATAFTGTLPSVAKAACTFIDVTIGTVNTTTRCAAPSSASACAAPTTSLQLATLAASTSLSSAPPTPSQTTTLIATIARDTTNTVATYPNAVGLHVTAPMTVAVTNGTFSATLSWAAQDMVL